MHRTAQVYNVVQSRDDRGEAGVVEAGVRVRSCEQVVHLAAVGRQHVCDFRGEIHIAGGQIEVCVLEARSHLQHAFEGGVVGGEVQRLLLERRVDHHVRLLLSRLNIAPCLQQLNHTVTELTVATIARH